MNKPLLRALFLIPVIVGGLEALSIFGDRAMPQQAQDYLRWYLSQPLKGSELVVNRLGMIGLFGIASSTLGLLFFWSPARYVYLASLLLVLPNEFVVVPTLITGWENFLDNVGQITIGLNLGLMFSQPGATYFLSKHRAA